MAPKVERLEADLSDDKLVGVGVESGLRPVSMVSSEASSTRSEANDLETQTPFTKS